MKFIAALLAIVLIGAVLGVGMGLVAHGHGPWFLIVGILGFLTMFVRYGCLGH